MLNLDANQLIELGRWHLAAGRYREAEATARAILQGDPRNPLALMLLGVVALEESRYPDAVARFREIIQIEPQNSAAHNNLGVALPGLGKELGFSYAQLGTVLMALKLAYGTGQFINGQLAERVSPRNMASSPKSAPARSSASATRRPSWCSRVSSTAPVRTR